MIAPLLILLNSGCRSFRRRRSSGSGEVSVEKIVEQEKQTSRRVVGSTVDEFTRLKLQQEAARQAAVRAQNRRNEASKREASRRTRLTDEFERAGQAIRDLQRAGKKVTKAEEDRLVAAEKLLDDLLGKKDKRK